jgi:hypothetical protein
MKPITLARSVESSVEERKQIDAQVKSFMAVKQHAVFLFKSKLIF